jgi:hypothetical protein
MYKEYLQDLILQGEIRISLIPNEFLEDKEFVLNLIEKMPSIYLIIHPLLREDYDICKLTIQKDFQYFKDLIPEFKRNKELLLTAIYTTNCYFEIFFDINNFYLLDDKNFMIEILKTNPFFITYIIELNIIEKEFLITALNTNFRVANFIPLHLLDKEMVDMVDPKNFCYLNNDVKEYINLLKV